MTASIMDKFDITFILSVALYAQWNNDLHQIDRRPM